jgi:hypothetical protein
MDGGSRSEVRGFRNIEHRTSNRACHARLSHHGLGERPFRHGIEVRHIGLTPKPVIKEAQLLSQLNQSDRKSVV